MDNQMWSKYWYYIEKKIFFVFSFVISDIDYLDTWKAMERLVDMGLVKSIGISNFSIEQIERLLANCRIKPVTNQVRRFLIHNLST